MLREFRIGIITAIALIGLTPLGGITTTVCFGQDLLQARDVLSIAKSLQVPQAAYQVDIIQTVTKPPKQNANRPAAAARATFPVDTSLAEFLPGEGLKRTPIANSDPFPENPTPKLTIDLGEFLDELMSYSDVKVELVEFDGRPHNLVSGQSDRGTKELLIWLDHEHHWVRKISLSIYGKSFAEIDFEYTQRAAEYWLPEAVHLYTYSDDSKVVLQFTNYTFSE